MDIPESPIPRRRLLQAAAAAVGLIVIGLSIGEGTDRWFGVLPVSRSTFDPDASAGYGAGPYGHGAYGA